MRVANRTAFSLLEGLGEEEDVETAEINVHESDEEAEQQPRLPPRPARPPPPPSRPQHPPDVTDRLTFEDKKYTKLCEQYMQTGTCDRPVCYFAHSHEQQQVAKAKFLRRIAEERAKLGWVPPPPAQQQQQQHYAEQAGSGGYGRPHLYKTHICWHYINQNGNCRFGDACNYAHGERELRQYVFDEAAVQDELASKGLRPMLAPSSPMQQQPYYDATPAAAADPYRHSTYGMPGTNDYSTAMQAAAAAAAGHRLAGNAYGSSSLAAPPPPPLPPPVLLQPGLPLPPPAAARAATVGPVPMSGAALAEFLDRAAQLHPDDDEHGVPDAFICPITQALFEDPVVAGDGFTYERHAIESWLASSSSSPMSNEPLEDRRLIPNHTLVAAMRAVLGDHVCASRQRQ